MTNEKFLYFSFGSNLSPERIRINNKSAKFFCVGLLKGYKFTFQSYSDFWKGSTANIIKDEQGDNNEVYGIIWELDQVDLANLDRQEVHYDRIEVNVQKINTDEFYKCYTYTQRKDYVEEEEMNVCQKPSLKYKQLVINGAKMNKFPDHYIKFLENFQDNGIVECGPKF